MIRDYESYTLLLASQSPRRRQLLEELGLLTRKDSAKLESIESVASIIKKLTSTQK